MWGMRGRRRRMRRCRLINREVAGSEGQRSPSLLLLPPTPTSSLLCSLPGANELLMAAEPLINSPSLPPPPAHLSSPFQLPPPGLLAELRPHWLLLLTVCQHISWSEYLFFFAPSPPPPPALLPPPPPPLLCF